MTEQEFTMINQRFDAMTTLMNAQFRNVNERLDKVNGSIGRHEGEIQTIKSLRDKKYQEIDDFMTNANDKHILQCPIAGKVRKLEDEALSNKSVKKFMAYMFSSGVALGALIVGLLKLILG